MDSAHTMAIHRFLLRLSLAVGNLFAWILIFHALYVTGETVHGALFLTACAFAFLQALIFFLTPLAGKNVQHGTARSMILASLALSAAYLWLASSATGVFGTASINVWWGVFGFIMLSALYRGFYWVPYTAVGISARSAWTPRTRFLLEVLLALAPAGSAVLITYTEGGAWLILVGASLFAACASMTLVSIRDTYEKFEFSYVETIAAVFRASNRPILSVSILEGMQGAGLLFLWPLTIFLLFSWSYIKLGLILSITLLIALLLRKTFQNFFRAASLHENRRVLALLSGGVWILRLIMISPVTIVIADSLSHSLLPLRRVGIDPVSFEQAADSNHYIDEYTALKEMGMALGRIFACGILACALLYAAPVVALAATLLCVAVASIAHAYRSELSTQ